VGDDQLSASLVWHVMLGAKGIKEPPAFRAEPRLERLGRVVNPGMDDAAVVSARVQAGAGVALEYTDGQVALRHRARDRQPADAASDDGHIDGFHGELTDSWTPIAAVLILV
jgi:hypothetical protein